MPNWCLTTITINHESEEKLKELSNMIDEWTSKSYKDNDFGLNWLGNIVGNSGVGTVDESPETDLKCRGLINYKEAIGNQLIIHTETAWVPMLKMWLKILEKYLPDSELIYESEECGCELYETNNPELYNRYVIDACDSDIVESDWNATEDEVREVIQKLCNTGETNIEKLMRIFNESDFQNVFIHKWDFANVDEWK